MSGFLIGFTVLVVFVLFYMSKRLICSGPNFSNAAEESSENPVWTSHNHHQHYCDNNDGQEVVCICDSSNNNMEGSPIRMERSIASSGIHSQVENRLRSQIFHMILAENEYRRLELEASRLARLLSSDEGINPEDYIRNIRNELSPLTAISRFRSPRANYIPTHCQLISSISQSEPLDDRNVIYSENTPPVTHFEITNEQLVVTSNVQNGNSGYQSQQVKGINEKSSPLRTVEETRNHDGYNSNNNNNDGSDIA